MNRQELIEALSVERYDNRWWTTPTSSLAPDDDVTCARRRRELAADFDALSQSERRAN